MTVAPVDHTHGSVLCGVMFLDCSSKLDSRTVWQGDCVVTMVEICEAARLKVWSSFGYWNICSGWSLYVLILSSCQVIVQETACVVCQSQMMLSHLMKFVHKIWHKLIMARHNVLNLKLFSIISMYFRHTSSHVTESQTCNHKVTGSNRGYCVPTPTECVIPPGSVNESLQNLQC